MASGWYSTGLKKCLDGTIALGTTTLKVMLVNSAYSFDPDLDTLDDGTSGDPNSKELVCTNYTGNYGGSGRKTATATLQTNDTSNRVDIAIANLTWTALGGATNDTIGGAILCYETGGSDATAIPIAFFDLTDTPTNGSDITLSMTALGSGGNLRISV